MTIDSKIHGVVVAAGRFPPLSHVVFVSLTRRGETSVEEGEIQD